MMPIGAAKFLSVAVVNLSSIDTSSPPRESRPTMAQTEGVYPWRKPPRVISTVREGHGRRRSGEIAHLEEAACL